MPASLLPLRFRRSAIGAVVASCFLAAGAVPVQAVVPALEMTIEVSDGFTLTFNPPGTDNGNGTFNYQGSIAGAGWIITWDFIADPDASAATIAALGGGYTVDNNTLATLEYSITTTLPLTFPVAGGSATGSAAFGVTGFGASLETVGPGQSMWEAFIDEVEFSSVLDHETQIVVSGDMGSQGDSETMATVVGFVSVSQSIGTRVQFALSPIAEMSMTGVFAVSGGLCVVVIDEETIDNDIHTIEDAADSHNVTPDFLINDDDPTLGLNPCLHWNELYPGDVVLIPGGQVNDEGIFALPEGTPWSLEDFVAGVVPQNQLDQIDDVMPLRSQELFRLVGLTCIAVVYDSDISINYQPLKANLQGERYGLFYFTVLGVVVPGSLPESGSSSSLYDLLVRVEPCLEGAPFGRYEAVIHEHPPDSIQIDQAMWSNGTLTVYGQSQFEPSAVMTLSVEDFILEAPMTYNAGQSRYEAVIPAAENLVGRRVSISTDEGGQSNTHIASPVSKYVLDLLRSFSAN